MGLLERGNMKRKHKVLLASLASTLLISGLLTAGGVSAHDGELGTGLADKLSSRFHLDKDEVRQVIKETRRQQLAERQQRSVDRLQVAVDNLTITAEQKDLILAKRQELREFRVSLEKMTVAEAREAVKAKHLELQKWASDNRIPLHLLMPGAFDTLVTGKLKAHR